MITNRVSNLALIFMDTPDIPSDIPTDTSVRSQAAAGSFSPADVWLSLLTPPLLIGIVGLRSLAEAMQQVGLASEELFRGDRLPTLTIPMPPTPTPTAED